MSKLFVFASFSAVFAVVVMLVGCSNQQPAAEPDAEQDRPADDDHDHAAHGDHAGHDHGEAGHAEHAGYADALAELSPADRALADKQKVCPVSGEPLGSMGTPYKVTVQGREVLLCCQGCEAQIKENPEKYLAKLPE
jgi:YHS domain-containing protein